MNFIPPQDETRLRAAASGVLPNGKAVVVNADGTVSSITSGSAATGSETVFEAAATIQVAAVYDSNSDRVVIAYVDDANSDYGTAIVGTISGTSISFGSAAVFESAAIYHVSATFDSNSNKVVIAYKAGGNSDYGTAVVATVSNTSISFGTPVVFESAGVEQTSATFDSNSNKVVIVYRDAGNSDNGTAVIGTVSNTAISFGTPVVFEAAVVRSPVAAFDSTNNKVVIAYEDSGNSDNGTAIVGTVSGTSISFGTAVVWESASTGSTSIAIAFDSSASKVVISYPNAADSRQGYAIVGTVSGTSISFGSAVEFEGGSLNGAYINSVYNAAAGKVVIAYYDIDDSNKKKYVLGTVSGTSISFTTPVVFDASNTSPSPIGIAYNSTSPSVIMAYEDDGNSSHGTAIVVQTAFSTLTAENYIGMSGGAVSFTGSAATLGSPTVFESAETAYFGAAFDSNSNRVVFAYRDQGNSNYGTAIVGTVSGTSISFGTAVVFESATTSEVAVAFDSNLNKIVIAYSDGGNSSHGTAIVGTVASGDNSISFGSAAVFSSASTELISIVFDTNANKFAISYKASSTGKSIVATVSGTSISFGSATTFAAYNSTGLSSAFDSNSNKVLLSYKFGGYGNEAGRARVGTVSGTSISFGTEATFVTADLGVTLSIFDASQNKFVVIWGVGSSSYAVVATISGTDVSFGATLTLSDDADQYYSGHYDSAAQKCIFVYHDNNDDGAYTSFTISGTTPTQGEVVVFESTTMAYGASTFDSNAGKSVVAYKANYGSTGYGTAVVFSADSRTTTRGEVASGSSASVDIIGTVSENQNALTAGQSYFVQTDGTIGLTAGSPSVFAGTAISATKLLVKT